MSIQPVVPPPVVPSHGTYTGECIGALQLMMSVIQLSQLMIQLMGLQAEYAITVANIQEKMQEDLEKQQKALWEKYNMDQVERDINDNNITDQDKSWMQEYASALALTQAQVQSNTKSLDPVLTNAQNGPNAISTSQNEFLQEAGTVNQGQQALANDRIN